MAKKADTGAQVVSLTLPAEPRWLALCRLVLSGLCQANGVDDETLADLKLAVTEACSNSVRHAYEEGATGTVSVRYSLRPDELRVEVADAGQGFEFDRPVPDLVPQPEDQLREDEMGLAIIHALVDEVEIGAAANGRGTRISFRKSLAGSGTV